MHLGIDYGTSMSKIVFRDYGAPGGERAVVVLRDDTFRIPSRLRVTKTDLLFGDSGKAAAGCNIYESIKMRVAAEVTGDPRYYCGPPSELPNGLDTLDLATFTVWFLISEGHRAVAAHLKRDMGRVRIGMTMGVPMAFFTHRQLRSTFLGIARRAWLLYRGEGLVGKVLPTSTALGLSGKYPVSAVPDTPEPQVRDWVRSEGEAAMWWPFQSPAVSAGRYAKVDIGAGTTHSSLFSIFGSVQAPKAALAFSGAATMPVGMDAVDRAIAQAEGLEGDCLTLRGSEQSILQASARARAAVVPVCGQIYDAYRRAWIETYHKIKAYPAELSAWQDHRIFVIGGGSLVRAISEAVRVHPSGANPKLHFVHLERPPDIVRADGHDVAGAELPFVTVAYGLSNIGLSIPEALTPTEVPPMPDMTERRKRLDHEDIYAK